MDYALTLKDFFTLILSILGAVVLIYLIIFIRNLNESIKVLRNVLKSNSDNIDNTLKNLPSISQNMLEITDTANRELQSVENVIRNIDETVEMTAAAAHTVKDDIFGKTKSIIEFIELIKGIFSKREEKDEGSGMKNE